MPLGVQFIGAAGRPLSETRQAPLRPVQIESVTLELRFNAAAAAPVRTALSTRSRLDAFAGRSVTKRSQACAVAADRQALPARS